MQAGSAASSPRCRSKIGLGAVGAQGGSWRPTVDAADALRELVGDLAAHAHADSPPLSFAGLLHSDLPATGNPY